MSVTDTRSMGRLEASKCPKCGEEPSFVEHIEKWYCYECNTYFDDSGEHTEVHAEAEERAEEPVSEQVPQSAAVAPTAESADFKDYSDDYEAEIAPEVEETEEVKAEPAQASPTKPAAKAEQGICMCPVCDQPLKWIEKYQSHHRYQQ